MAEKKINIAVGADVSDLKDGLKTAVSAIKQSGNEMQKSASETTEKTQFAFKNLTQAYRSTNKDAQYLAATTGENSAAFIEAAAKAGEYKNQLDDVNAITKAMSSDTPVLSAALGVGQGLAGAFAAAQGAMAVFGTDSEALQQTLIKVQGSIALLSGLQALGGLQDSLVALSAVVTTKVVPALASIGITITASGLGAAVLVVTALAGAYYYLSSSSDEAAQSLQDAADSQASMNKELFNYLATSTEKQISEENIKYATLKNNVERQKRDHLQLIADKLKTGGQYTQEELKRTEFLNRELEGLEKAHQRNLDEIKSKGDKSKPSVTTKTPKTKSAVDIKSVGFDVQSMTDITPLIEQQAGAYDALADSIGNAAYAHESFMASLPKTIDLSDQLTEALNTLAVQGFQNIGIAIGEGLANGTDVAQAALQGILSAVGGVLVQFGELAIAAGVAGLGIQAALSLVNPAAAIAAGIALVALGSYVSSQSRKLSGSASNGGGSSSASSGNSYVRPNDSVSQLAFKPMSTYIEVGGQVRGNNLKVALINTDKSNRRVR